MSTADIAEVLGFETRQEAHAWLAQRGIPLNYTQKDLEQDRKTLQALLGGR